MRKQKKNNNEPTIKNIFEPVLAPKKLRIAAYFIDIVLFVVLFTGVLYLVSFIVGYQSNYSLLQEAYKQYGVYVPNEDGVYGFCVQGQDACTKAWETFFKDDLAYSYYEKSIQLLLIMFALSAFITSFIYEFIVPICFKNGQTIGMKILRIGLLNEDKYRVTNLQMFIRFLFGKFIINLLLPIFAAIYYVFFGGNIIALLVLITIPSINLIMTLLTKNGVGIANSIGKVVPISMDETYIFDTKEDFINAKCEQERLDEENKKTW